MTATAHAPAPTLALGGDPPRCRVMGVVNVTPDSFSDGGRYVAVAAAVDHGVHLMRQGADLVDVGGESTRPGATRVSLEEELRRVVPVVRELVDRGVPVSVDTMRASVARAAVDAGAVLVNDVSGGLADPAMLPQLAETQVPCVLMHWRGHSHEMDRLVVYGDVVGEVCDALRRRTDAAVAAGVRPDRIVLDPGLGFAKDTTQSWTLLAHLDRLTRLGFPVLVGASRKRFLAACVDYGEVDAAVPGARDDASHAVAALAAAAGAWAIRVHDAGPAAAAVRVAARLTARGSAPGDPPSSDIRRTPPRPPSPR